MNIHVAYTDIYIYIYIYIMYNIKSFIQDYYPCKLVHDTNISEDTGIAFQDDEFIFQSTNIWLELKYSAKRNFDTYSTNKYMHTHACV